MRCACLPVRNVAEGVVGHSIADAQLAQLACQPVMPVESRSATGTATTSAHAHGTGPVPRPRSRSSNADTCRHPGSDTSCRSACCAMACRLSRLHGREDADQPGCYPRLARISFTRSSLRKFRLRMNSISIPAPAANFSAFSRIRVPGMVGETSDNRISEVLVQKRRHSPGKADLRQRPENQHPVVARKHSRDLISMSFGQQRHAHSGIIIQNLFGSGSAG